MYRIVPKVIFAITSELRGIYEYRTMQSTARNIMRSKVQHLNFDARGELLHETVNTSCAPRRLC